MIIKKTFNELTTTELYEIIKLRTEVFVLEQTSIYQDLDDLDKIATHYYILNEDKKVITYARFIPEGYKYETASFGRVVTKKEERRKGISKTLLEYLMSNHQVPLTISAQIQAQPFYEKLGFIETEDKYLEDGIPHVKMIRK